MSLSGGSRLGPYAIISLIGAGGMGEVYRARDSRLDRVVAVKVLPEGFARDDAARDRFDREARAIASLSHPHICTLHDVGRDGETNFLVMELLEGGTLAERLTRGPLPLAQASNIAREVADALDHAHRHGIVHRDLKPGNIFLTRSGAKLLDFGLAKGARADIAGSVSVAATAASPITAEGTIVGTLNYMAPEQLQGREADARSDIWALGCVIHEMVTGVRPFDGATSVSVMAAILERQPEPLRVRQPVSPAALEHIVTRCLEKDPEERWQSARDVLGELRWIERGGTTASPAVPPPSRSRARAVARAAGWVISGVLAASALFALRPAVTLAPPPVYQFDIAPQGGVQSALSLSQDGRYLATISFGTDGKERVSLRTLAEAAASRVVELQGISWWAWTPGNGFLVGVPKGLHLIDAQSGATLFQPGNWARGSGVRIALGDTQVLIGRTGGVAFPLQIWSADGQQADATSIDADAGERRHVFPAPAGNGLFTFQMERSDGAKFVCVGGVGTPHRCDGPTNHSDTAYYSQGHVLYRRSGALIVRPFDLAAGKFTGGEQSIPISTDGKLGATWMSASLNGTVVFGVASLTDQFSWFDRAGRETVVTSLRRVANIALAPDDTRALLQQGETLALLDLRSGATAPLGATLGDPLWSPDGRRVAHRTGAGVAIRSIEDPTETVVYKPASGFSAFPEDWSPDGRWIVATLSSQPFRAVLVPTNGGEPRMILPESDRLEAADEFSFSADGRWLAFNALIAGRAEVFVMPNPPTGRRWQVTTTGGMQPRWGRNGELYYLTSDGTIMQVATTTAADFATSTPRALFKTGLMPSASLSQYAVAGDGRFLVKKVEGADREAVRAIVNWPALWKAASVER
jgi:hypothetical protein